MSRALLVAALLLVLGAADARAAATPNTCRWSLDDLWRDQAVELVATPAPVAVAPGGSVTLAGTALRARLPEFIAEVGYNTGLLRPGRNDIPFAVWVALRGGDAAQTVTATATTTTTIRVNDRQEYQSATPLVVDVPLPDSAWTAPSAGALAFAQAAPGTLPRLPVGRNGAPVQPLGSIVAQATMPPDADPATPDVRITLDCQPGTSRGDESGPVPAAAGPFASVPVQADAPTAPPGAYAVPAPAAAVRIRSVAGTAVRRKRKPRRVRLALRLGCTRGTGACFGDAVVRTARPRQVGGRLRRQRLGRSEFSIGAGGRRTLAVQLTKAGRTILRRNARLRVAVSAGTARRTLILKTTTRRPR